MTESDIKYYHSCSNFPLPWDDFGGILDEEIDADALNNIFDNLYGATSRKGKTDYRCIFVQNNHATETLRNAKLYIHSEKESGSFIDLGINQKNDQTTVSINGYYSPIEGETLELYVAVQPFGYDYNSDTDYEKVSVAYHPNPTIFQGRFQTELRAIDTCKDAIVSVVGYIGSPTSVTFTVDFKGSIGSRVMKLIDDSSVLSNCTVFVDNMEQGTPINVDATTIDNNEIAPSGIDFLHPTYGSPFLLGDLAPNDYFAIWFRRITPPNTLRKILDNVKIKVEGSFP